MRSILSFISVFFFLTIGFSQTGPNSPSAAVNIGAGTAWSNPTNVFASDNARATSSPPFGASSSILAATGFGFSIPATDLIDGILVRMERSRSPSGFNFFGDITVQLTKDGSSFVGTNNAAPFSNWQNVDSYNGYGGAADLWGTTWTPAEINNANFGVGVAGFALASGGRIDYIEVTVYHSPPLPITLINFDASITKDNTVKLTWSTASETNNDYFTLERATNLEHFEAIEIIAGSGTTNKENRYETIDPNPAYGRSYYRLKQTDFDGQFAYSDLEVVDYDGPRLSTLRVFPNPSEGHNIAIEVIGLKNQATVPVQIYNTQGQKVYDEVLPVTTPGTLKEALIFGSPLPQGLYIVKAGQTLQLTQKIIVD